MTIGGNGMLFNQGSSKRYYTKAHSFLNGAPKKMLLMMLSGLRDVQFAKQSKVKSTSPMRSCMELTRSQSPFLSSLQPLMPVIGRTASLRMNRMWEAFPDAGQDRTCLTSLLAEGAI